MYKKGFDDGVSALAQYITDHACCYDIDNYHSFEGIDIDELKYIVEEVQKFVSEIDGWIPCCVEMPKEEDRYLVTIINNFGFHYTDIAESYLKNNEMCFHQWNAHGGNYWTPNVVAWQPLSKPYKG